MDSVKPGPFRYYSHCPTCGPMAYATQKIADDKTELHQAMCVNAPACHHPHKEAKDAGPRTGTCRGSGGDPQDAAG